MKKKVQIAVCAFFAMVLMLACGSQVLASNGVNVEYHSQDEIRQMAEMLNIQKNLETGFADAPILTAPYKPGKLAEDTVQNGLNTLNLIRYVAGIPYNVKNNDIYEQKAQAAALVNRVNGTISHSPAKPEDMEESLYQLGAEGAGSSNLGMGYGNLYQALVSGWMADDDNSNIDRAGHRRWCLNPGMESTGFGIVGSNYAMYAFDGAFNNKGYTGVAWPAQNMPVELFSHGWFGSMPWSISMGSVVNPANVHVTLTRKGDGKIWNFSAAGANGEFFVNNGGYGQSGCIIFRPSGVEEYKDGDSFHVEIEGAGTPVSYDVEFFSMHQHQYETVVEKDATCTEKGREYEKCKICQMVKEDSYRDTLLKEHSWRAWETVREGTYTREGVESRVCTSCKKKETRTLPMIPKLKKVVSPREDSLTVTWNPVKGADGYRIYVKNGKRWSTLAEVKGTVTSYRHKGLTGGTAYTYTVRAFKNREPKNTYSGYNKSGITGITTLPVPKLKNAKVNPTYIKLTWSKVSSATGYIIYRKTGSGGWTKIATITSGSTYAYADKNIKNGNTYIYTVRATRKVNGRNICSSYDKKGIKAVKPLDVKDYKNSYPSTLASIIGGMKHRTNVDNFGKNEYYRDDLIIRYAWGQKVNHVINGGYSNLGVFGANIGASIDDTRKILEKQGFSCHYFENYVGYGYVSNFTKGWDRITLTSQSNGKISSYEWIGLVPKI